MLLFPLLYGRPDSLDCISLLVFLFLSYFFYFILNGFRNVCSISLLSLISLYLSVYFYRFFRFLFYRDWISANNATIIFLYLSRLLLLFNDFDVVCSCLCVCVGFLVGKFDRVFICWLPLRWIHNKYKYKYDKIYKITRLARWLEFFSYIWSIGSFYFWEIFTAFFLSTVNENKKRREMVPFFFGFRKRIESEIPAYIILNLISIELHTLQPPSPSPIGQLGTGCALIKLISTLHYYLSPIPIDKLSICYS